MKQKRFSRGLESNPNAFAYLINAPSLIIIFVTIIYPVLYSLSVSLEDWNLRKPQGRHFIGLGNYLDLLSSPDFLQVLGRTASYVLISLACILTIGLLFALVLSRKTRGIGILRSVMLIPWAIPAVVNGIMWKWFLDSSYGIVNAILKAAGIIDTYVAFLAHPTSAFICIIVASVWKQLTVTTILILASLQTIPNELYEAATVDGASSWKKFRGITLPMIGPSIMVVLIYLTTVLFREFDLIYVLTYGGPGNATALVGWTIYEQAFALMHVGKGAAVGYILALITFVIAVIYIRLLNKKIY